MKKPTDEEYRAFNQSTLMLGGKAWKELTPEDWTCPICERTKRGIMRWGVYRPREKSQIAYALGLGDGELGWRAGIVLHHDHASEGLRVRPSGYLYRGVVRRPRFSSILICQGCNAVEGKAKTSCKAPKNFSFSPEEIRRFIISVSDNGPTIIDTQIALSIWTAIKVPS